MLMLLLGGKYLAYIEELIITGADLYLEDKNGKNAITIAKNNKIDLDIPKLKKSLNTVTRKISFETEKPTQRDEL